MISQDQARKSAKTISTGPTGSEEVQQYEEGKLQGLNNMTDEEVDVNKAELIDDDDSSDGYLNY